MKKSNNYKLIFGYLGIFLVFVGVMCLLPLMVLIKYHDPYEVSQWTNFFIPGISSIAIGVGLMFLLKGTKKVKLGKHQDSVLLVLVWLCAIIICAIPFFLKKDNMNFTESVFETTSGFSTIGLTVFTNFIGTDSPSRIYIFWRSLLTLIGGVGLVLVITTAISDKFNLNLYSAEGHSDKLLPNLKKSALAIFSIYLGLILVGTILYSIVFFASGVNTGDEIFEALIHSISAVATGGFSSRAGGLMEIISTYGHQTLIELISIFLMLAGSVNFLTHLFIITGQFKKAWKDCEIRFLTSFIIICVPVFFLLTLIGNTQNFSAFDSLRHGAFTFFSAITTTGFSTVKNVAELGQGIMFLVIILNIIGGGAGSTAGGVKQYRVVVAIKSFYWGTKSRLGSSRMIYPHYVSRLGEDKDISPKEAIEAFGYIGIYLALMFVGGLFVTMFAKSSFGDGLFEFSNAISSTGLSNGITASCGGNNPANFGVLWTLIVGMFAGRLEILPIYFGFYRIIRDILGKETN